VEGLGDGLRQAVTVDVNPKSRATARSSTSLSTGGAGEAHHMGRISPNDRSKHLGGRAFGKNGSGSFDIATDHAKPKMGRTIGDLAGQVRVSRAAHRLRRSPADMFVRRLSNT